MDFHTVTKTIITVSTDKTIRLWDVRSFDEVYEFSSHGDQPLCIAAHPNKPIFACGFESGKMRIFYTEDTDHIEEFSQFTRPLRSLRYDNTGKVLVTCSEKAISIHNANR